MMRQLLLMICCLAQTGLVQAQSAFLNRTAEEHWYIERCDVINARLSDSLHTALSNYTQHDAVRFLTQYSRANSITERERQIIRDILAKHGEWSADGAPVSKRPLYKTLYGRKPDLLHITKADYDLVLNPVIAYQQTVERGNMEENLFINTKGIEARGNIGKTLGFYTIFTDNQERGPKHHQYYVANHQAVPGAGYYKDFKPAKPGLAQDYLYAAGYLDANFLRKKVNVSFGHYRFQIGDGYRSLFLGDFGSNYLFLKLNTRLGRFNYQNLFMELTPQYKRGPDQLLPKKYAAMHHLSVHVARWLNLGFFESVVFTRKDHFEFGYMNPIIFYRSVEQGLGSPDNAMLGMNFRINTPFRTVIYGQLLLDEFKFSQVKAGNGWWGNKYGVQLGMKLADLFGIRNLLIQPEINVIRPFTYSYSDGVAEYSHYNQSLAHPFGANLAELSLQVKYMPVRKLTLSSTSFFNKQGRDTASVVSFGGNIFNSYSNRAHEYGNALFNGFPSTVFYTSLNASYEWKPRLYFDLGCSYRNEKGTHAPNPDLSSLMLHAGLRLNALRRTYDY